MQTHWVGFFGTRKVSRGDLNIGGKQRRGERKSSSFLSPIKKDTFVQQKCYPSLSPRKSNETDIVYLMGSGFIGQVHFIVGYVVYFLGCVKLSYLKSLTPYILSAGSFHLDSLS